MPAAPVPLVDAAPLLRRFGATLRRDAERVPLARASGRVLAESTLAGDARFPAGLRLGPGDLGPLAAAGIAEVLCTRRPTVAVFTVGPDLMPAGHAATPGMRYDAARPPLMAWLQGRGLEPVAWPILSSPGPAIADAAQGFDLILVASAADGAGIPVAEAAREGGEAAIRIALGDTAAGGIAVLHSIGEGQGRAACVFLPDRLGAVEAVCARLLPALLEGMLGERSLPPASGATGPVAPVSGSDWPLEMEAGHAERLRLQGAVLVDIREPAETAAGVPAGAALVPRERLLADPGAAGPSGAGLLLVCASGVRSLAAARALREAGHARVASVRGGVRAWQAEGRPMEGIAAESAASLDADARERYARHLLLPQVGVEGQARLLASRVLLVGAGGLGSPAAFYLAAAGVGRLRLVDDDRVERSNLQRQILHADAAVGRPKVASARERLLALNPRLQLEAVESRLDEGNVDALLAGIDVVLDGSDNFSARHCLNRACLRHGIPLVYGAVERFHGQVSVFDAARRRGERPCYQCLFPEPEGAGGAPNCAEAGVLGVLPGVIGLLQATEALKLLLGQGESLAGRLLLFDALAMRFRELPVPVDPACPACGGGVERR